MNIQTEHLENHTARLTVEVDTDRLEQAKQAAARKIARSVAIPGFRKGKAPATMVTRYVGEARVLEEAIDSLGQEIYRESLEASQVNPYGPGALEDVRFDTGLTFVYTVPLQPTVELGDYRAVRQEYIAPVITDDHVEQAIKNLQEQEAQSEETEGPVIAGNRVTVDVHSFFVDEDDHEHEHGDDAHDAALASGETLEMPETEAEVRDAVASGDQTEAEAAAELEDEDAVDDEDLDEDDLDEEDEDDHHHHGDGEPFIHEHDLAVLLREGKEEPVGPGFVAAMLGATPGETRTFRLTYPTAEEDPEITDEVAGKTVEFTVTIKKIETVTLPEIDDAFAAKLTDRFADPAAALSETTADAEAAPTEAVATEAATADAEAAPTEAASGDEAAETAAEAVEAAVESAEVPARPVLNLEQLRERVRASLYEEAKTTVDQQYSDLMLDSMVNVATVHYPEAMLEEQLDSMLESLDQRLRGQGLTLDTFMMLTRKSREDVRDDYRPSAESALKRSLVLFEVAVNEKITVTPEDYTAHVDQTMKRLGVAGEEFRRSFDNPTIRENIINRLLQDKTFERIVAIGRGEAPELPAEAPAPAAELEADVPAAAVSEGEVEPVADDTPTED